MDDGCLVVDLCWVNLLKLLFVIVIGEEKIRAKNKIKEARLKIKVQTRPEIQD